MKFGLFYEHQLPRPWDADSEHRLVQEALDQIEYADRLGIEYVWEVEHHFLEEYSHLSANESFLAYLAGVTENIHLGSGIMNITPPVNHPARVAERVAMIDHLSHGRFEFGMGRGSSSTEQKGFGIDDPDLTKLMFDEVLAELPKMWADGKYSYEGTYFSMPERNVLPKTYTKPHPPMWVAAGNPGTFEKAGRLGLGILCFGVSEPEALKPLIDSYKTAVQDAEPIGGYVNDNVMVTTQMLCLEDGEKARHIATDMTTGYHTTNVFRYLDTFPRPPGIPEWPTVLPDPTYEQVDQSIKDHMVCIGTPEECAKTVERYQATGADQLTFGMLSSTMPVEIAIEAVETFGQQIIPAFDKDPVHSTTRQREALGVLVVSVATAVSWFS